MPWDPTIAFLMHHTHTPVPTMNIVMVLRDLYQKALSIMRAALTLVEADHEKVGEVPGEMEVDAEGEVEGDVEAEIENRTAVAIIKYRVRARAANWAPAPEKGDPRARRTKDSRGTAWSCK